MRRSSYPKILLLGGGVAAGTVLAVLLSRRRRLRSEKYSLPLPYTYRGWVPWLGIALSFFKDVNEFLAEKRRRHGKDPFRYLLLGQMWVFTSNQTDMRTILTAPEQELSMLSAFQGLIGSLLPKEFSFASRHHFFVPAMRGAAMQQFVTTWHGLLASELTELWPVGEGGVGRVELFDACKKLIMRMNLRGLLGPAIFEEGRYEAFYQAFEDIDPEKSLVDVMGSMLSPSKTEAAWVRVKAIVSSLIDHYEALDASPGGADRPDECTLHWLVRLAAKGQDQEGVMGRKLGPSEASGHIFAFSFASLTNTFAVLAWCIIHLMAGDSLRQRVTAELFGRGDAASLDSYESVPVTRALINEVVRLHTPGLIFRKVMLEDGFVLSTGHRVPQGELVGFSVRQLNREPGLYGDDGLDFNIDRFLEPRSHHKAAGSLFVLWGAGRHPCLGTRFANVEIAMLLRALFSTFDFEPLERAPRVNLSQLATVDKPLEPVHLTFTRKR